MNKLKVGMWIRNCYGRIAKIDYIEDNVAYCDNWLYQEYEDYITFINIDSEEELNEITKTSFNIIDLIETGDYVNGYKVYEIVEYENNTRAIVIGDDNKSIIWEKSSQYIKSIVTKEQFEQMKYEVE